MSFSRFGDQTTAQYSRAVRGEYMSFSRFGDQTAAQYSRAVRGEYSLSHDSETKQQHSIVELLEVHSFHSFV